MADPKSSNTPPATAAMAATRDDGPPPRKDVGTLGRGKEGRDFELGERVTAAVSCHWYERTANDPLYRPLRIYALDPGASVGDGALAVVNVPYEPIERISKGIRGRILEVIDDGLPGEKAEALDLDNPFLLIGQGRLPSPEDPLFRQQMAYAVCSTTYAAFRQALGRDLGWGFRRRASDGTPRLRIRPTISELENAFYDPDAGELQFGVFRAGAAVRGRNVPGGRISLCFSHDIVVHEMSHALLDAMRSRFLVPTNPDVLAFHEAFADLIAIFQRFTYLNVVSAAIRRSRGNIAASQLLTDIGVQFGQAMNLTGALRSAVGSTSDLADATEPHRRGEVLVSAVFRAFATLYERRTASLVRLASDGSGVLPPGEIPELLASALSEQATRLAAQFLTICIRAIDYCPPVDITFGEYLRAVLTADRDVVPSDRWSYREAWVDAFAERRIYPPSVSSLSEQALLWGTPEEMPAEPDLSFAKLRFDGDPGKPASAEEILRQGRALGALVADRRYLTRFGLAERGNPDLDGDEVSLPVVQSIRPSRRVGPSGQVVFDLIAEVTQQRKVASSGSGPGFVFHGGATVILDPHGRARYVIRKSLLDRERLNNQREFVIGAGRRFHGRAPGASLLPQSRLLAKLHDETRPQLRASVTGLELARDLASGAPAPASKYLLRRGDKSPAVPILKACLNRATVSANLDTSDEYDAAMERAVSALQTDAGAAVDGVAGPTTWSLAAKLIAYDPAPLAIPPELPEWIRRILSNNPSAVQLGNIDVPTAIELYEFSYGPLNAQQGEGLRLLLRFLSEDPDVTDLRWAAYMLATVKWECGDTWRPIEEHGRGADRKYGVETKVPDENGVIHVNRFYGRGYVQLTWRDNYREIGERLGMGRKLEIHPELALEPGTAYQIASYGMRHGTFTGRGLAHYIAGAKCDYRQARKIINGVDQAERIAGYARRLETMLVASV